VIQLTSSGHSCATMTGKYPVLQLGPDIDLILVNSDITVTSVMSFCYILALLDDYS